MFDDEVVDGAREPVVGSEMRFFLSERRGVLKRNVRLGCDWMECSRHELSTCRCETGDGVLGCKKCIDLKVPVRPLI